MIYLLEDDSGIRELVCYALGRSDMETKGFSTPKELRAALEVRIPSLIMLDIMLPGEDGVSVLRSLRSDPKTANVPIIMLTARDSEFDKVNALDTGADDYVTKPFGVMELIARVKALIRRSKTAAAKELVYTAGEITLSVPHHTVKVSGNEVYLTVKEFELLCYLMENRGIVLDRDKILSAVWGYAFDGESRTVDVHIRSLRSKLGESGDIIETVRGVGYKIP